MHFRAVLVVLIFSGTFNSFLLTFGLKVRLAGGKSNLEGRIEIYHNSTWGTVCSNYVTDDNYARVFCFMLGYDRYGARVIRNGLFGAGNGPIWLDKLICNGLESSIEECKGIDTWGSTNCNHNRDAWIICQPKIRLVEGESYYEGRIEVNYSSTWGTVCGGGFGIHEAQVFCHMLGFNRSGAQAFVNTHYERGFEQVVLNNVSCSGNENSLNDCNNHDLGLNDCTGNKAAWIKCLPKRGIRLTGGSREYEGLVEIYHESTWGTICYDDLSNSDAQVLCNMLGYPREDAIAFNNAYFGQGTGQIWLNYLDCDGQESSIVTCKNTSFEYNNCSHENDVGIRCQPRVRLVGSASEYEGRVEVFHSGQWGTVCDDSFDETDAQVLCYMLGYQRNGSEVLPVNRYGPGTGTTWLDDLICRGIETSIDDCLKKEDTWGSENCNHYEDAVVKCRPSEE